MHRGPSWKRASARYQRTGTEALRPRSHLRADAAEPIDLDAHDQALLARLAVRVLVHPKESFREFVGVGVGSRLRHRRGAVQDEIRLRFVAVLNGDDDPRVTPEILRLLAPFRRVEQRLIALNVHPDHRHLRPFGLNVTTWPYALSSRTVFTDSGNPIGMLPLPAQVLLRVINRP